MALCPKTNVIGSITYANETAKDLVSQGKARFDVLSDNEAREKLFYLADYLIERG